MRCEQCKNKLLQKSGDRVRVRIKGPVLFDGGKCTAQCYWCKSPVELPLSLSPDLELSGERFLIGK